MAYYLDADDEVVIGPDNYIYIPLGPFVDATDGVTPETGLAGSMVIDMIRWDGGNVTYTAAITHETIVHLGDGWYRAPVLAGYFDTPQAMYRFTVSDSSVHLPVWEDVVLASDNYMDLIETGDFGIPISAEVASLASGIDVNVTEWNGTAVATPHTAGYPVVTVKDGTGTGEIDTTSGKVSIATDGLNAAALATDAVTEIVAAVWAKVCETQGSYTAQQILSIALAALAGVTTNNGDTIKTPNGSATRIAATVDHDNDERYAMTLTPSS